MLELLLAPPAQAARAAAPDQPSSLRTDTRATTSVLAVRPAEIRYAEWQVESILSRAREAWKDYRRLRPQLRKDDPHEQGYQKRAVALRYRLEAVERLIKKGKKSPTDEVFTALGDALTWLDRATAAVEYDHDRVTLRMKQERLIGPGRPFFVGLAPAYARISPTGPSACQPAGEAVVTLAAGESESFQLVVVPYWEPVQNVRVEIGSLFREGAIDRLRADQVKVWAVECVASTPTVGRPHLWPDPLRPARPLDLPATATQSLLVDLRARKDQPPGLYRGQLTVTADHARPTTIPLHVVVRPFAIDECLPELALWVRNDYLQSPLAAGQTSTLANTLSRFLAPFALGVYRHAGPGDAARDWQRWPGEHALAVAAQPAADPYSLAAPTALPYRQAGWAAWKLLRGAGMEQQRWLVGGWVTFDLRRLEKADPQTAPLIRLHLPKQVGFDPPGLIYLAPDSTPEPTLRLIVLRDGIEDYAYLRLLARLAQQAKETGAAGWWARRRWNGLLHPDPWLMDPAKAGQETGSSLLLGRQAIAEAIQEAQRALARVQR